MCRWGAAFAGAGADERDMGEIVEFKALRRRTEAPALAQGGSAEIHFFTGVRYERTPEPEAAPEGRPDQPAHGGPGRKKRRRA